MRLKAAAHFLRRMALEGAPRCVDLAAPHLTRRPLGQRGAGVLQRGQQGRPWTWSAVGTSRGRSWMGGWEGFGFMKWMTGW